MSEGCTVSEQKLTHLLTFDAMRCNSISTSQALQHEAVRRRRHKASSNAHAVTMHKRH